MIKNISIAFFFIAVIGLSLFPDFANASVPAGNRMALGNISDILPADDMRDYYSKMEPVMLQYFGPPFSSFTLDVEGTLNASREWGIFSESHSAVMVEQAIRYANTKETDYENAIRNVHGFMKHEFSHALYITGNDTIRIGNKWFGEGWANVLFELMDNNIDNATSSPRFYYEYYMDRDVICGEGAKQDRTHGVQYSMATATYLTLISAASTSNDNLDFYKKLNSAIYDHVKNTGNNIISLAEYQSLVKPMLTGIEIDGVDAFEWYFNSPTFYQNVTSGLHMGVYMESRSDDFSPSDIQIFVFNRSGAGDRVVETGLAGINTSFAMRDYAGRVVLEKNFTTDGNGDASLRLENVQGLSLGYGTYSLSADAVVNGKRLESRMFALVPPKIKVEKNYLYGVLLDENNNVLDGKYVSALNASADFIYRKNGIFIINVSDDQRVVTLDFMGLKQEVTKGSFARVYAFKIGSAYVDAAKAKSDAELNNGVIDNTNKLNTSPAGNGTSTSLPYEGKPPVNTDFFSSVINWLMRLFGFK